MSQVGETFFTVVGCMDGRVQDVMAKFGERKFESKFPDTVTEAGIVGLIAKNTSQDFFDRLKFKLLVSVDKHHSKGILVDGHAECAGNPVDDEKHIQDIKVSVEKIRELIDKKVPVVGVFVKRNKVGWVADEISA